jgi:hypothetical protein
MNGAAALPAGAYTLRVVFRRNHVAARATRADGALVARFGGVAGSHVWFGIE